MSFHRLPTRLLNFSDVLSIINIFGALLHYFTRGVAVKLRTLESVAHLPLSLAACESHLWAQSFGNLLQLSAALTVELTADISIVRVGNVVICIKCRSQ